MWKGSILTLSVARLFPLCDPQFQNCCCNKSGHKLNLMVQTTCVYKAHAMLRNMLRLFTTCPWRNLRTFPQKHCASKCPNQNSWNVISYHQTLRSLKSFTVMLDIHREGHWADRSWLELSPVWRNWGILNESLGAWQLCNKGNWEA